MIGVPLTAITNSTYTDPRQRQLFKNIIYLGVLSALLDMDVPAIEGLLAEQFKGRDKLIAAMKGMAWESPRGPISIDPDTRDIVSNIYIRKVEKIDGELWSKEFETFPNVKDSLKVAAK